MEQLEALVRQLKSKLEELETDCDKQNQHALAAQVYASIRLTSHVLSEVERHVRAC